MYTGYRLSNRSCVTALLLGLWLCPVVASAQERSPWGMHMMWGSWGIGMMLMMMLFWAAIIIAIIFLIRWLVTTGHPGQHTVTTPHEENVLDILKKRYARGEISKPEFEEFEEMRQDIQ